MFPFPPGRPQPDLPLPLPPGRQQPEPVVVPLPMVPLPPDPVVAVGRAAIDDLVGQRRILVSGPLDGSTATELSARLMMLDGVSSESVEVVINSGGGPVADIFAVLDVIALMRAPVNVTAIGAVSGTAIAVLACGTGERRAAPHASFSLHLDSRQAFEGRSDDVTRWAEAEAELQARYLLALQAATGQSSKTLKAELARNRTLNPTEVRRLGIIDPEDLTAVDHKAANADS